MTYASKRKLEFVVPQEEIAKFFQRLAQAIETGSLKVGETELTLAGLRKISISAKATDEGDGVRVRLKAKYPKPGEPHDASSLFTMDDAIDDDDEEDTDDEDTADQTEDKELDVVGHRLKYKVLKKLMKAQFKDIRAALAEGRMPERDLAHGFVRNSDLMVTYPGKGDEFYGQYSQAVQNFMSKVTENDIPGAAAAAEELENQKKICHEKYD